MTDTCNYHEMADKLRELADQAENGQLLNFVIVSRSVDQELVWTQVGCGFEDLAMSAKVIDIMAARALEANENVTKLTN